MERRSAVVLALVVVLLGGIGVLQSGLWVAFASTGEYERTTVTVVDEGGSELGSVDARVADTDAKRLIGLSRTNELGADEGMLFVHEEEARHSYVMRNMAFPLDIVFVAANGTVTTVHHAAAPDGWTPEPFLEEFTGHGKYVLEVERGWTNRTGVGEGDRVRVADDAVVEDDGLTGSDDRPTVTAVDANGTTLGTVTVDVAANSSARYTGLSDTEALGPDEGMLFVHDEEDRHAYVMRDMDFPLDIVFVAANGTVTTVHHAPLPPEGTSEEDLRPYRGTGKYVLEVNRGWTNETGLEAGDRVEVPDDP